MPALPRRGGSRTALTPAKPQRPPLPREIRDFPHSPPPYPGKFGITSLANNRIELRVFRASIPPICIHASMCVAPRAWSSSTARHTSSGVPTMNGLPRKCTFPDSARSGSSSALGSGSIPNISPAILSNMPASVYLGR